MQRISAALDEHIQPLLSDALDAGLEQYEVVINEIDAFLEEHKLFLKLKKELKNA